MKIRMSRRRYMAQVFAHEAGKRGVIIAELTGAAPLYGAASSDRRERG